MTAVNLNRAIRGPVTAVPVVAGHGVRIVADTANNRFVAEADETVLFDGNGTPVSSATLSESMFNFEKIKLVIGSSTNGLYTYDERTVVPVANASYINLSFITGQVNMFLVNVRYSFTSTTITADKIVEFKVGYDSGTSITIERNTTLLENIFKVVGINRIASN